MTDLISREELMKLWDEYHPYIATRAIQFDQALRKLPSAYPKKGKWIPCSEGLPEDDTEVIVSCTDDSGDSEFSYSTTGWHFKGMWVVGNERSCFVRAWMPLP